MKMAISRLQILFLILLGTTLLILNCEDPNEKDLYDSEIIGWWFRDHTETVFFLSNGDTLGPENSYLATSHYEGLLDDGIYTKKYQGDWPPTLYTKSGTWDTEDGILTVELVNSYPNLAFTIEEFWGYELISSDTLKLGPIDSEYGEGGIARAYNYLVRTTEPEWD